MASQCENRWVRYLLDVLSFEIPSSVPSEISPSLFSSPLVRWVADGFHQASTPGKSFLVFISLLAHHRLHSRTTRCCILPGRNNVHGIAIFHAQLPGIQRHGMCPPPYLLPTGESCLSVDVQSWAEFYECLVVWQSSCSLVEASTPEPMISTSLPSFSFVGLLIVVLVAMIHGASLLPPHECSLSQASHTPPITSTLRRCMPLTLTATTNVQFLSVTGTR